MTERLQSALRDIEKQPDDSIILKNKLRSIESKLAKVAEAIETVGVSDTLAKRLAKLEQDRTDTEKALERVPAPVKFLPDVLPALVARWRELAESIEELAENPAATGEDLEAARTNLHALLGSVTLKRRNGILWAHPAPNAKGLVETRPLDGLRINSPFIGSGGALIENLGLYADPFPLVTS
jgi:chromosome segregation ATPase